MNSLSQLATAWLQDVKRSCARSTFSNYSSTVRHLLDFQPELCARFLTRHDIVNFRDYRCTVVSARTSNRDVRSIKAMLNWAWLNEHPHPPVQLRKLMLPEGPREDWTLDRAQSGALLETADRSDPELAVVLRIQAATGLRLREACALVWSDVDFARGVLTVSPKAGWSAKTQAAYRSFPAPELVAWLEEYRATLFHSGPSDPICQRDRVRGIGWKQTSSRVCQRARAVFDAAGVNERHRTTHRFRHTIATDMADSGVPIHVAQALLGHSTPQVTQQVYTHARRESVMKGALHLEAWRRDQSGR